MLPSLNEVLLLFIVIINEHLRSEFCSEKLFKTEIWVLYMTRNCKICNGL